MAQVGLAQVWSSWQARAHPKRDTGSGRQASGSRAVLPLARPSRQPSPPPDSATSAPHSPARRAGRRRRTVPLVPRATRTAHDADGTAEWHRWARRKFGRPGKRGRTPRMTQAQGGRASGSRAGQCHSPAPAANRRRRWTVHTSAGKRGRTPTHAPDRRAGRRRRTVPLVPRATRPAHDADGTAEWHRWAWRKFGRPGKRGRTPRGTQAQGGRRLGAGPVPLARPTRQQSPSPDSATSAAQQASPPAGQCH